MKHWTQLSIPSHVMKLDPVVKFSTSVSLLLPEQYSLRLAELNPGEQLTANSYLPLHEASMLLYRALGYVPNNAVPHVLMDPLKACAHVGRTYSRDEVLRSMAVLNTMFGNGNEFRLVAQYVQTGLAMKQMRSQQEQQTSSAESSDGTTTSTDKRQRNTSSRSSSWLPNGVQNVLGSIMTRGNTRQPQQQSQSDNTSAEEQANVDAALAASMAEAHGADADFDNSELIQRQFAHEDVYRQAFLDEERLKSGTSSNYINGRWAVIVHGNIYVPNLDIAANAGKPPSAALKLEQKHIERKGDCIFLSFVDSLPDEAISRVHQVFPNLHEGQEHLALRHLAVRELTAGAEKYWFYAEHKTTGKGFDSKDDFLKSYIPTIAKPGEYGNDLEMRALLQVFDDYMDRVEIYEVPSSQATAKNSIKNLTHIKLEDSKSKTPRNQKVVMRVLYNKALQHYDTLRVTNIQFPKGQVIRQTSIATQPTPVEIITDSVPNVPSAAVPVASDGVNNPTEASGAPTPQRVVDPVRPDDAVSTGTGTSDEEDDGNTDARGRNPMRNSRQPVDEQTPLPPSQVPVRPDGVASVGNTDEILMDPVPAGAFSFNDGDNDSTASPRSSRTGTGSRDSRQRPIVLSTEPLQPFGNSVDSGTGREESDDSFGPASQTSHTGMPLNPIPPQEDKDNECCSCCTTGGIVAAVVSSVTVLVGGGATAAVLATTAGKDDTEATSLPDEAVSPSDVPKEFAPVVLHYNSAIEQARKLRGSVPTAETEVEETADDDVTSTSALQSICSGALTVFIVFIAAIIIAFIASNCNCIKKICRRLCQKVKRSTGKKPHMIGTKIGDHYEVETGVNGAILQSGMNGPNADCKYLENDESAARDHYHNNEDFENNSEVEIKDVSGRNTYQESRHSNMTEKSIVFPTSKQVKSSEKSGSFFGSELLAQVKDSIVGKSKKRRSTKKVPLQVLKMKKDAGVHSETDSSSSSSSSSSDGDSDGSNA